MPCCFVQMLLPVSYALICLHSGITTAGMKLGWADQIFLLALEGGKLWIALLKKTVMVGLSLLSCHVVWQYCLVLSLILIASMHQVTMLYAPAGEFIYRTLHTWISQWNGLTDSRFRSVQGDAKEIYMANLWNSRSHYGDGCYCQYGIFSHGKSCA